MADEVSNKIYNRSGGSEVVTRKEVLKKVLPGERREGKRLLWVLRGAEVKR